MIASQKTDINKRDMNFFSEFSTSGSQVVSSFAIVLLVFILAIAVALGSFLYIKIKVNDVQKNINEINAEINDPNTALALAKFENLQVEVEDYRTNLFIVSQLDLLRRDNLHANTALMDRIADSIPDGIILTDLIYSDGQVLLAGNSRTYGTPLEFVQILQDKGTFQYVSIESIETLESGDISGMTPEQIGRLMKYKFSVVGALESFYSVVLSKITDDESQSLLSPAETMILRAGETFTSSGINSIVVNDQTYTLSRILINGELVGKEDFDYYMSMNEYSTRVTQKIDVKLYYVLKAGDAK
ncbi:MAG: PilN domain-containing protein [Clostridiaceae bacterium]|nr:PilN domain-containing protein [Clostridiaceae bacterium]